MTKKARGTPTFDLTRFTQPQVIKPPASWFFNLPIEKQDYLLEVAKLFTSRTATWSASAAHRQLKKELDLNIGYSQFSSFLYGRDPYANFHQEVQDARAEKAKPEEKRREAASRSRRR